MEQVLAVLLVLLSARTCTSERCFREHELSQAATRLLRGRYPQPQEASPAAAASSPLTCPVQLYQQPLPAHLAGRSLSPWRYMTVSRPGFFPPSYVEAQCLCSGCILVPDSSRNLLVPSENHSYNSVPIRQSRVFLRRELCRDGQKYRLRPVTLQVAVGCTCVRPRSTS